MKWRVNLASGESIEIVAESVYVNPVGALIFLKKATVEPPPEDADAPKKKAKKPKPVTVGVRAFGPSRWHDYELVDE